MQSYKKTAKNLQTIEKITIFAPNCQLLTPIIMKKKYLLWSYAVIACVVLAILCSITFTSIMGMKAARNAMSNPENRKAIYDTAAKVMRDTGLKIPNFRIHQHKPGEYHDGSLFRDTLVVHFYKGIPDSVYTSFIEKARAIEAQKDTTKSVEIDSINYFYQDHYVNGFSCYLGVHISKKSQYGEIIYGNWRAAKE